MELSAERAPQLEVFWRVTGQWHAGKELMYSGVRLYSVEEAVEVLRGLRKRHRRQRIMWRVQRHEYWEHVFEEGAA